MKHIKKIFEFTETENHFPLDEEDIRDACLPLTDIGYRLEIENWYTNSDRERTREPVSDKSSPFYQIRLFDETNKKSKHQIDSDEYYEEPESLELLRSCIKTLQHLVDGKAKVYYNTKWDSNMSIIILFPEIKTDIGFDWNKFKSEFDSFLKTINDLFDGNPSCEYKIIDHWSRWNETGLEISSVLKFDTKEREAFKNSLIDIDKIKIKGKYREDGKYDNKSDYIFLKNRFDSFMSKYGNRVKYKYRDDEIFNNLKITYKTGMFSKPRTISYTHYIADINIEKSGNTTV